MLTELLIFGQALLLASFVAFGLGCSQIFVVASHGDNDLRLSVPMGSCVKTGLKV